MRHIEDLLTWTDGPDAYISDGPSHDPDTGMMTGGRGRF